jgi:hypothetical protein
VVTRKTYCDDECAMCESDWRCPHLSRFGSFGCRIDPREHLCPFCEGRCSRLQVMREPILVGEFEFASRLGLEIGYDDDDETKHQYAHLCWNYASYAGALCKSDRLWGQPGIVLEKSEIDCVPCLKALHRLRKADLTLLDVIGKLSEAVRTLRAVEDVASGIYCTTGQGIPREMLHSLREALDADQARHAKNADEASNAIRRRSSTVETP